MSDAMSAIEIEDVLSSIRRLVSEDLRPATQKPVAAEPRLILTPALRVVPKAEAGDFWDETDEDWAEEEPSAALSPSGWSLPEAEPEPAELDPATSLSLAMPAAAPTSVPMQPASARTAGSEVAPESPLPPHRFTLTQAARVLTEDQAAPLSESHADVPEASDAQPWDQPVGLTEQRQDDFDLAAPLVFAGDAHWADRAAAEAIAGIEADQSFDDPLEVISESDPAFLEENENEDDAGDGDLSESSYDEVHLRELVRDILREELAGALGEKITRNVRKLVRAEIAQALATRDLG